MGTRIAYRVGRLKWVVLSGCLALAGLVDLRVPLPDSLAVALAGVAAVMAVWDYIRYRRELATTEFQERASDRFQDIERAYSRDRRFETITFANGSVVHDHVFSESLSAGLVEASVSHTRYARPADLVGLGRRYIEQQRSRGISLFPGPMLGLATNLEDCIPSTPFRVELTAGDYYDHLCSDGLATVDVIQNGRTRVDLGRRLFVDRHGRLRGFADSWLLNGIGTSILAFTSDGKLLTLRQSERNESSPGLLAPAGSGALEPQDADAGVDRLDAIVVRGGVRELREESGVRDDEVDLALMLGFGRWLEKAGRPEFYSVCFLSVDSHTLDKRPIARPERGLIRRRRFDRLPESRDRWVDGIGALLPSDSQASMSVPLAMSLTLLLNQGLVAGTQVAEELLQRRIVAAP